MNPMVSTILILEKELELQQQGCRNPRDIPEAFLPDDFRHRRKSRKSLFERILRPFKSQRQPACECTPGFSV